MTDDKSNIENKIDGVKPNDKNAESITGDKANGGNLIGDNNSEVGCIDAENLTDDAAVNSLGDDPLASEFAEIKSTVSQKSKQDEELGESPHSWERKSREGSPYGTDEEINTAKVSFDSDYLQDIATYFKDASLMAWDGFGIIVGFLFDLIGDAIAWVLKDFPSRIAMVIVSLIMISVVMGDDEDRVDVSGSNPNIAQAYAEKSDVYDASIIEDGDINSYISAQERLYQSMEELSDMNNKALAYVRAKATYERNPTPSAERAMRKLTQTPVLKSGWNDSRGVQFAAGFKENYSLARVMNRDVFRIFLSEYSIESVDIWTYKDIVNGEFRANACLDVRLGGGDCMGKPPVSARKNAILTATFKFIAGNWVAVMSQEQMGSIGYTEMESLVENAILDEMVKRTNALKTTKNKRQSWLDNS
jgi:hypothetical protein